MEKEIIVKPSFNISSTMKGTFYILLKPWYIFFLGFLLIVGVFNFLDSYLNVFSHYDKTNDGFPTFAVFIILFPLFLSFSIYRGTKKQINENPRLKEDIRYIFNNECFLEKGDTFEVKHFWKNLFKIVEKKDMFLFYTTKNRAIILQKKDLTDNQNNELKQLFNSIDIKKSLKS
ncbi:YcxB family protein [Flavobacterium sp. W22_SRS_FK3]|uniref:YcxB family protein n=1 Tax=Flavobacterium sp. W22_SRS_FK3 TaxID=3240275 RepID=UPI003F8DFB59